MPGHSWSIPASFCQTGSKLAAIPGTPCSLCYARKGRYNFSNVKDALENRYIKWKEDPDWINLMIIRLLWIGEEYFRWFDSGDLQSVKMLTDINQVAANTPNIKHWLPTQERGYIKDFIPTDNLVIRVSSTKLDEIQAGHVNTTSIGSTNWTCPSSLHNNTCGPCRKCWDKNEQHIIYKRH